jgi:serine/threonine protein kinase
VKNIAQIKIFTSDLSDEFKENGFEELKLMAKLQSDCVVQYKNSWIENNQILFIQMELCFSTLKDILLKKRTEFQRQEFHPMSRLEYYISSELFKEILKGVNFLHKLNIIHRDLKPTNILITDGMNGRFVKLADFGLAIVHKFDEQTHTEGSGTFKYMAPEVQRGRTYDMKADIYSLGVITQEVFDIDFYA